MAKDENIASEDGAKATATGSIKRETATATNGNTTVSVDQTVATSPRGTTVTSQLKTTSQKGNTQTTVDESSVEHYGNTYRQETTRTTKETTFNRQGNPIQETTAVKAQTITMADPLSSTSKYNESPIGYRQNVSTDNSQTKTYDNKGNLKTEEFHQKSPAGQYRSDEILHYNNRQEVKESMRASYVDKVGQFSYQKNNKNFGVISYPDGSANYELMEDKSSDTSKVTVVYKDKDGKLEGYTAEKRKDVATNMWQEVDEAKRKILSVKEAEKARKKIEKVANQKVAQSFGAQDMTDYQNQVITNTTSLSTGADYFSTQSDKTNAEMTTAAQAKKQETEDLLKNRKTAEQVAQWRLKEQQR